MSERARPDNSIIVRGAREHNLRGVDLKLPKRQLVVFTGVSGSGKSSMAFDTLFAEGQRRYVESLSVYARMFVSKATRPAADEITGLSPTVSIEQKTISHNPRSTVGTITEIHDHLRVLYAQLGRQHCTSCGAPVGGATRASIGDALETFPDGTRYAVLSPLVRNRKGEFRDVFERLRKQGYSRVRVDGELLRLEDVDKLKKNFKHDIDVFVDRLISRHGLRDRIDSAVASAAELSDGLVIVLFDGGERDGEEQLFSTTNHCVPCGLSFRPLTHQSFSFNSPVGWCPACTGIGTRQVLDTSVVLSSPDDSISDECFLPLRGLSPKDKWAFTSRLHTWCGSHLLSIRTPWRDIEPSLQERILYGDPGAAAEWDPKAKATARYVGIAKLCAWISDHSEDDDTPSWFTTVPCPSCGGGRLNEASAAVRFASRTLPEVCRLDVTDARALFDGASLAGTDARIGDALLDEIRSRLRFLDEVGLRYLALDRTGPTLSGGEAQRIRLARQIGSELTGVLYVLDEPSIGLHQRDNARLLQTLQRLRDAGNTVIVVEHDQETIEAADWLVDFGPGAGRLGGEVVFQGPGAALANHPTSVTAAYLSGRRRVPIPAVRRTGGPPLVVRGARAHNLASLDIAFPTGTLTCVTGVSGAGKSTLVNDILHAGMANRVHGARRPIGAHDDIEGADAVDKVIGIDQSPIGRTPRSNPATYTKLFDEIRAVFASLPDAKIYGYAPGRFSFNVAGGRCETCAGAGVKRIEMGYFADVFVECESCRGRRFNEATLRVRYRGRSIADVLATTFEDALDLFEAQPRVRRALQTVVDVGLGYITLGQPSPTLSGGEAQRMKLSRELAKVATGRTLYVLDEPTTGLHFEDVTKLLHVLHRLADNGNTIVVVEHNLDFIAAADHVIDLGPEGGRDGGRVVVTGTPEAVAAHPTSETGRWLTKTLAAAQRA